MILSIYGKKKIKRARKQYEQTKTLKINELYPWTIIRFMTAQLSFFIVTLKGQDAPP